ncbi:MAG TPA: F0F1 ATP synthase subunit B [Dehalococcoidales bacterium]|nr:F0F1 ATP synthase subunit B [Dehalococcoidales bacterium]
MEGLAKLGINVPVLLAQIVNFTILFVLLYLVAYKPILKMLDSRSKKIEESVKQTEYIKEQVAHAEEESKKRIDAAGREGQELIVKAMRTGEEVRQQAQQDAQKDAETLITRARTEIQRERDGAIDGLRREFADLTIMAAEKVIEQSLDKEAHRRLIDRTLEESKTFKKG